MEHTTNRTFICSVVFLDIVDYSQQPVDEQIRLKSRFNEILAEAIKDVAVNDRIILDTGDGAAISFLGDPEDALFVALNIRDTIIAEGSSAKPRLSACIGINLGPVKLVQDINRQRNLIGDGINVAQRVMSFAKPGQILVSRSYFEVISRLSQEYAKLFHYEGSRADKHVREHQVYSVYPVEKEKDSPSTPPAQQKEERHQEITGDDVSTSATDMNAGRQSRKTVTAEEGQPPTFQPSSRQLAWKKKIGSWNVKWFKMLGSRCVERFKILGGWCVKRFNGNALRNNRMILFAAAAVIVILISVPVIVWKMGGAPAKDPGTVPSPTSVAVPEVTKKKGTSVKARKVETPAAAKKAGPSVKEQTVEIPAVSEKAETSVNVQKAEIPAPVSEDQKKPEITTTIEKPAAPATVSLGIAPWGEVYVDGQKKGVSPPLNRLQMAPGKHTIEIRNTAFPPYKQTVDVKPGEHVKIKHKFP
ncbi:MAG: PEGA domain-containing protein [Deltaproteobacteria bacterium]|nr:PEGA domain-containing protein [Deltaproteobacteria bacterium]